MVAQERIDFGAELFVLSALLIKKQAALLSRELDGPEEELLQPGVAHSRLGGVAVSHNAWDASRPVPQSDDSAGNAPGR